MIRIQNLIFNSAEFERATKASCYNIAWPWAKSQSYVPQIHIRLLAVPYPIVLSFNSEEERNTVFNKLFEDLNYREEK